MSQDKLKKLVCSLCKNVNYYTTRRIKGDAIEKLELKKFCKHCRAQTIHKEAKK